VIRSPWFRIFCQLMSSFLCTNSEHNPAYDFLLRTRANSVCRRVWRFWAIACTTNIITINPICVTQPALENHVCKFHLDSCLGQVNLHCQVFPGIYVGVMSLCKNFFQFLQLRTCESGTDPTLLSSFVQTAVSRVMLMAGFREKFARDFETKASHELSNRTLNSQYI